MAYTIFTSSVTAYQYWTDQPSVEKTNRICYVTASQWGVWMVNINSLRSATHNRDIVINSMAIGFITDTPNFKYQIGFNGIDVGTWKATDTQPEFYFNNANANRAMENAINGSLDPTIPVAIFTESGGVNQNQCWAAYLYVDYEEGAERPSDVIKSFACAKSTFEVGETGVGYSGTIHNPITETATSVSIQLFIVDGENETNIAGLKTESVCVEYTQYTNISGTININSGISIERGQQVYARVTISGETASMSEVTAFARIVDVSYHPEIIEFELERYVIDNGVPRADTSGVLLRTDMRIALDGNSDNGFILTAYASKDAPVDIDTAEPITINISGNLLAQLKTGVTENRDLIVRTGDFSNGNVWNFLLVLSDGVETAQMNYTVESSFANLHLAGFSTGGVAFGQFSTSTQGHPKLECAYPAYFTGGMQFSGYDFTSSSTTIPYTSDEVEMPYKWTDGKRIYRRVITFNIPSTRTGYDVKSWGIDKIISLRGQTNTTSGGMPMPFVLHAYGTTYFISLWYDIGTDENGNVTNKIICEAHSNYHGAAAHVIVEYTKAE